MSELVMIKYGVGLGLAVYVIERLLKIIMYMVKDRKKAPTEDEMKRTSRDMIRDIHEVVTEKSEGVPLVYNKGLEKSINKLNGTMENLATSIQRLAEGKK